jgi:phenylacetate-CoA ligase
VPHEGQGRSAEDGGPTFVDTERLTSLTYAVATLARLLRQRRGGGFAVEKAAARVVAQAEHARAHVPYYRDLYGDMPLDALSSVPLADKASMVARPLDDRLSGPAPPESRTIVTSGTTGVPMSAIYSPGLARWFGLLSARRLIVRRARPWSRWLGLAFATDRRPGGGLLGWLRRRSRRLAMDMPTDELVRGVVSFRPRVLTGHPHRLLDVGLSLPAGWRPELLLTHGETIDPVLRASLERTYGTAPIDSYGTTEVGPVAWQCRARDLYHIDSESVLVEILDQDDLPVAGGTVGNVVVTGLTNRLMPFIRYRMADRAALADRPCRCGHRGPALSTIVGRSSDFALDRTGRPISPELLWLYTNASAEVIMEVVRRYQVHQRLDGTIELRMELHAPLPDGFEEKVLASYARVAGGQPVEIRIMDDIGDATPGKFRLVSSELATLPR